MAPTPYLVLRQVSKWYIQIGTGFNHKMFWQCVIMTCVLPICMLDGRVVHMMHESWSLHWPIHLIFLCRNLIINCKNFSSQ